jgi:L-serine/L-threonine ammonia-lyase
MKPLHLKTPLLESQSLGFVKMDAVQPTGSFKIRGIGALCQHYAEDPKVTHFISLSGGNAGIAVAYAGRKLGIPVKVVVPHSASDIMLEHIRAEGAEVTRFGADLSEADTKVQALLRENPSYAFVHPFDHPLIWKGHSSLVYEFQEDGVKPTAIVVAVGGGGLLCGVIQGLHEIGWSDIPVIAAETEGAASMAASLKAGELVTLDSINTIAVSLGAKQVAKQAFEWSKKHEIISAVVSDKQATDACIRFADEHRVLVEPSCGAALAAVYDDSVLGNAKFLKNPIVIACGGNAVNLELLRSWG